jgi:glutamate-1-semialdehyde 2,1-aminomutase
MRAGLATLEAMTRADGWAVLDQRTTDLAAQLSAGFAAAGLDLDVIRHASIFWIRRRAAGPVRRPDRIPPDNAEWFTRFFHAALSRGIYLPPSPYEVCFLSMAHDPDTLATATRGLVDAAREADGR